MKLKFDNLYIILFVLICMIGCQQDSEKLGIKTLDNKEAKGIAEQIEATTEAKVLEGLKLSLWASDSLLADPVAISIDGQGRIYATSTERRKSTEFDIRGHADWMIPSISMQSVEDRRAFIKNKFTPERSAEHEWLIDHNGDGSHDWRDLTVEKEQVFRIEDKSGDGIADYAQLFMEGFNTEISDIAGSVLSFGDDVFVGVAPDMWRLRDENGDGQADFKESISHGYQVHIGFGGHNLSGLTVGPDGKIYWGIGDIGSYIKDKTGKEWKYPNQGAIFRANPDGTDFEVFAAGLRNTHEFVFDEYGNLFSVDNDGDHPGESERMVYIVNGSDAGWRTNWQFGKYTDPKNNDYKVWMDEALYKPRFEGQAAHITPCIRNYRNGPCGMVYNPGTALSKEWKNYFFMAEFVGSAANSKLWGFKLKPKGASFDFVEEKQLLEGIAATGMDIGPDGALYFADWIGGWDTKDRGRIWKLDVEKNDLLQKRKQTRQLLATSFKKNTLKSLGKLLSHEDMRVRMKAQFELVKKREAGQRLFEKALQQRDNQLARIHGVWGLAQMARKDDKYAKPLLKYLKDRDPEVKAQTAKWLGDIRYEKAGKALIPLLKDKSTRVQFFAAEALGRIKYNKGILPIIEMLEANDDKDAYLRHAGALALSRIGDIKPIWALKHSKSRAARIAAVVALRRLKHEAVADFLKDKDEFIVTEAARAINDDWSIERALPDLAAILNTTSFQNEALIRRAINANLRVGKQENIDNLVQYIQRQDISTTLKVEAIAALGTWANPSEVDRVDGRYRGKIKRDAAPVVKAFKPLIANLLSENEAVVEETLVAVGRLKVKEVGGKVAALFQVEKSVPIQIAALSVLDSLEYEKYTTVIGSALNKEDAAVRAKALEIVPNLKGDKKQVLELINQVLTLDYAVEEKQAAVSALKSLPIIETKPILQRLLKDLKAGKLPFELVVELSEVVTIEEALSKELEEIEANLTEDKQHFWAIKGGNEAVGRGVLINDPKAQCLKCHKIWGNGSDVGPELRGVSKRLSEQELVESLVAPNKKIAENYGAGMPNMSAILSRREIRDVVAFLKTL